MDRREVLSRATYAVGAVLLTGRSGPLLSAKTSPVRPIARPSRPAKIARPPVARTTTQLSGWAQPRSVCRGRAGVVVVGATDDGDPVSWSSDDGVTWREHHLAQPSPGEAEVWGVAAYGDRFVAVGSLLQLQTVPVVTDQALGGAQDDRTFVGTRRVPTVWWTSDRANWTAHMITSAGADHAQLISVACTGDRLVAVGSTLDDDGAQGVGGLVLTSTDGTTWRRGEVAGGAFPEGSFTGVAFAGDTWFATSTDMDGGTIWSSADGQRWAALPVSRRRFHGMSLQGIGVRDREIIVAGTGLADHRQRYFASGDGGHSWRTSRPGLRGLDRGNTTLNDLTVMAGDVVVVGTRDGHAVIEGGSPDGGN